MSFRQKQFGHRRDRQRGRFSRRPSGPRAASATATQTPARTYTESDLHLDIVNASFVEIRQVQTGTHADGKPVIEYVSEDEARARGFHDQWVLAESIDKGLKHQEETG